MADDNAYRFETSELKLRHAVFLVSTNPGVFGDSSNQRFPVAATATHEMFNVDISQVYIKNAGAGNNTTINVIGTRL